ncbi:hypothetical protein phiAS5_ORF0281 [Aeromonas phage phiAS5]|uniref:Uncharacterized protein n=1 Tax=Aeromonas phage phiAS5 TaxID=879630 RepID=E1A235_9CAUD|nr:hypothetical protein phiAS5_ORF0281 [Aeromonas phage phiAS5]ADM80124.1 hypothetical protein phiAS5_ORF0281 [Aeromonas phage phiAS5]BES53113.1 hypothetical protein [Aeromonas phage phiWae14]
MIDQLKYFRYQHLPEHLQPFSKPFHDLAEKMIAELPDNEQRKIGLQKLIEAKDCFVRAKL